MKWRKGEEQAHALIAMNADMKRYKTTGRIAFHSNGGTTNIQLWVRAPQLLEIETDKIPLSLDA